MLHEFKSEEWFWSLLNLYLIQFWQTITNDETLLQLKENKCWKHCSKNSALAAVQKFILISRYQKLHRLFVRIHWLINWKHNVMIQISFEIQLQMINSQSSKCSSSSSCHSSSTSFCQENSSSKSNQEKNHSQSQDNSVSQKHVWNCNKKTKHMKADMLN